MPANDTIDYYLPRIAGIWDYYPFGMQMPGRVMALGSYKYGFNGKETDDEISGIGNQYDYGFRIYNPRLGRFLSVDPLAAKYPFYTPYQFAGNKPIWAIDLDGLEEAIVTQKLYDFGFTKSYLIVEKSDELMKLWNSVNREDRVSTQTIYYGVLPKSERGKGSLEGFTIDFKEAAKFVQICDFSNDSYRSLTKDQRKQYHRYKQIFNENNIDWNEVAKSDKKVYGIFLDPTDLGEDGANGAFNLLHEIKAHLKNRLNGIVKTQKKEHYEFYNYDENLELLEMYPELKNGELSPPYEDIPENSPAGEIKKEIDKVVQKGPNEN